MTKLFKSKILRTGILALSIAVIPATSAFAQAGNTNSRVSTTTETVRTERDNDWGWLGLLGLTGLLGLIPKKQRTVVTAEYRDTGAAGGTAANR